LERSGVPYALSFIVKYEQSHRIEFFVANLIQLNEIYFKSDPHAKSEIEKKIEIIVDNLVMPNGVKKTTYTNRLSGVISEALCSVRLADRDLRILDVPSSTGTTSRQTLELLQKQHRVERFVLGDLYHNILYDKRRRCVYDEQGNLLQVAFKRYYFNIYKGHEFGEQYTLLSTLLLLPHSIVSWFLKKRYRLYFDSHIQRMSLIHPDVERLLNNGVVELREVDIFNNIPGEYDLIISFNLLQKNYFSADAISVGIANLAASLTEGGVLVLGDTESYRVMQKEDGILITCMHKGEF